MSCRLLVTKAALSQGKNPKEHKYLKKDVSVTTKPGICLSHRIPVLVLKSAADSLALIPLQREIWYLFSEEGKL